MNLRIRELREDNDLTQKQIAKYLNCAQGTYSRYENNKRSIPIEHLVNLADFYGVSINDLIGRKR